MKSVTWYDTNVPRWTWLYGDCPNKYFVVNHAWIVSREDRLDVDHFLILNRCHERR